MKILLRGPASSFRGVRASGIPNDRGREEQFSERDPWLDRLLRSFDCGIVMNPGNLLRRIVPERPLFQVYPKYWIFLFVILAGLDLASKLWITGILNFNVTSHQIGQVQPDATYKSLYDGVERYDLPAIPGNILTFRLVFNDRFVFGTGPSAPVLGLFLTSFALIFLFFYRWHNWSSGHPLAWLLVFSGAAGNLIDKIFVKSLETRAWIPSIGTKEKCVSGVVDFIDVIWFGWKRMEEVWFLEWLSWERWPTFNIADSMIVVGIILLLITTLFDREQWKGEGGSGE